MTTTLRPVPAPAAPAADRWYAICANGRPIGRIHLADQGRWGAGTGWIHHVEVTPERQRRGHACVAMLAAEEILRGLRCGRLAVTVPEGAVQGMRLAASLGYRPDSRTMTVTVPRRPRSLPPAPGGGARLRLMDAGEAAAARTGAVDRSAEQLARSGWPPVQARPRAQAQIPLTPMTYALEEAGAPLGTLLLAPGEGPPRRRGPYGRILALETVADRRREGWGRVLLNSAVRIAHDAGWRTLDVEVPEEPEDGRRLCGAYGFRTEERHLGKFLL